MSLGTSVSKKIEKIIDFRFELYLGPGQLEVVLSLGVIALRLVVPEPLMSQRAHRHCVALRAARWVGEG